MRNYQTSLILLLLLLFTFKIHAQIKVRELTKKDIPADIKYEGNIVKAFEWEDRQGLHIVLTSETGNFIKEGIPHESGGSDAELFAYHFLDSEDLIVQVWKVYDYIHDCELDMEVTFIPNTLQITDLNNDQIPEIWLIYKKACRGDVSPSEMKIIMYENTKKYAMRGENKIQISENETYGGEFQMDKSFQTAHNSFKEYAINLWNKNIMKKWD